MRRLAWTLSFLAVALGAAHLSFTPGNYPHPTMGMLWFIGTGLALIFAGLLNVFALRAAAGDQIVRWLTVAVNLTCAVGFGLSWLLLQGPQVIVGAGLFGALTVASVLRK
jgi:hypothetical protein